MSAPAGATAHDWAAWTTLGLTADLLPVVSDPVVPISPHSQMQALGKTPSYVNHEGNAAGIKGWTAHQASEVDILRWRKDARLGICLIGRHVKGIDIDVPDPALAQRIQDMLEVALGALPERYRSDSGKRLLAVRCDEVMPKIKFQVDGGVVELLANSQQFIVAGTHPSGARYQWRGGVPSEIPAVSAEELRTALRCLFDAIGTPGTWTDGRARLEGAGVRRSVDSEDQALVDWLWEHSQVREEMADGTLCVPCPWETEHSEGAGAPSSTVFYPAGVGAAKRGFKCLHAHCEGRSHRDYLAKVGYTAVENAQDFEVVTAPAAAAHPLEPGQVQLQPFETDAPWPNFEQDQKTGKITCNNTKVVAALSRPDICGARIGYDEFKALAMIEWFEEQGTWRGLRDTDYVRLKVNLEKRGFTKIPSDMVREAVARVAEIHQFDSAIQWVTSLQWDGIPRVERFFVDCFAVEDTPYSRAVGRYTWTALAGRAESPGCKVDMTPVLIGGQGLRKTSGVRAMAPLDEMFVEIALDIHDDNLARKMRGKLVGELGELRGLAGKDAEAIKQWFTRTHEEWTPKYREFTVKFPRRLLLIGTGNTPEFLEDATGARRFLPMTVRGQVDIERIERDRNQLWAEGRHLFCHGGHGVDWKDAEELAKEQHAQYTIMDDWTSATLDWLARDPMDGHESPTNGQGLFTTDAVLTGAIGLQLARISRREQMRMANLLTTLGYEKGMKWLGGTNVRVWKKAVVGDFGGFA